MSQFRMDVWRVRDVLRVNVTGFHISGQGESDAD